MMIFMVIANVLTEHYLIGTPAQLVFGILIAFFSSNLYIAFNPMDRDTHNVIQNSAQLQIFLTLFLALLISTGTLIIIVQYPKIIDNYFN